jgi:hypothetical protein
MAEIINILPLNPNNFEFQEYSSNDLNLIVSTEVETSFDNNTDYIEYYVYDLSGNIIVSNIFGFPGYKLIDNQVSIDPVADLAAYGYEQGSYNTLYNFLKRKLGSNPLSTYYIDEISSDRTEIRLNTTEIPNIDVVSLTNDFINEIQTSPVGYVDFYLDFGDNQLIIANNILLDNTNIDDPTILIKLYEPLPEQFTLKTQCWVVQQIANSLAYNISITPTFSDVGDNIYINRPNFNLSVNDTINNSTDYTNYTNLTSTTSSYAQGTGSLQYQLNNLLAQKGLSINIDYSNYSNFIHFSSAQTRLENFYYKLQLLEQYNYSASFSATGPLTGSYYATSSNIVWQAKIDEIITTFDPYEYYLYYTSASTAWPKTGDTPPYTNYSTTSTSGSNWFISQSLVAEEYDIENNNALTLAIPSYILENSDNYDFELFVEMIGQSFDSVFVYLQDVTNKYNADNRLNYGVSKDLVADILRDLGIKIYQNNFSSNDLYQALIGITPSGSLYNLPFTTTLLPVPSGSFLEYITTYVTSSSTSSLVPTDDINKERYKRIYHNLPLLLKKKGSVAGLRDLITTFGVTDTILRINEFGGKDKNPNTYDNWQDEYNYAFYTSGSSYISSSFVLNSTWGATSDNPQSVEFRFRTDGLPQNTASISSQSLWETNQNVKLVLKYTGSGYTSGSYSGSIINPYYQYAKLDFAPDPASISNTASVYLPFYNEGWWSVLINKNSNVYTLYAKNKNYDGEDGNVISFQASSSVTSAATSWNNSTISYFGISSSLAGKIFTGSLQEIRYYTLPLSESNFNAYVMNPYSIESSEYLSFRATLGGELYTSSVSVHPKVTGSWVATSSFASNSNFYTSSGLYIPNQEIFYFDQVPSGIQNAVSQKIKQQNIVLPYSSSDSNIPDANVLSPFVSIQQFPSISSSYTRDIDYVEIGFSPQNEINEDINSQIGYFNLGEVIGDPRFQSSSLDTYPALDAIRDSYFQKYISNYQELDYIRLIEFFDNSLFKMFADWVPARTSLASGIIIKNTLLDRNRYRVPQVSPSASIAFIGSGSTNIPYVVEDQTITGSIDVGTTEGSNGGSMPELFGQTSSFYTYPGAVNIDQVWYGATPSLSGSVPFTASSQEEFFNGELSGSNIVVTNGTLSDYEVITPIVYTSSSFSASWTYPTDFFAAPLEDSLSRITQSGYINYDFEVEKTYYLSFTATVGGSVPAGGINMVIVNSDNTFANGITSGSIAQQKAQGAINLVGGVNIIDNYEVVGLLPYVYLLNINGIFAVSPPSNPIIISNFVVRESTLSNPNGFVIQNDAQVNRPNSRYMDVDFATSQIIAVNQQAILSGSATRAAVPDSYYTTARIINPRYIGKELVASNLNKWTEGDISYGKSVTVGNPEVNFVYFNNVGSTSPEWGNNLSAKTQANIKLIINDSGSVTTPINDAEGINLGTIQQSFVDSGNATLVLDDYDTFGVNLNSVNGTYPIFKSGVSIAPILYTQTASYNNNGDIIGYGYTSSITFVQGQQGPDAAKNNYQLLTYGVNYNTINGTSLPNTLNFSTPVILGAQSFFSTSSDAYNPTGSLPNLSGSGYILNFQAHIEAAFVAQAIITYAIQKNGVTVSTQQINHLTTTQGDIYYTDTNATISDLYTVKAITYQGPDTILLNAASYFRVTQYPLPGTGICNNFWYTGSGTPNILLASTASEGLNQYIGQRQQNIERSGFDPISLDFEPQLYDEIRFQGIEDLAYSIINISSSNGQLRLQLDGNIPNGTNLSYFLLRRYVNDPSNIILDLNKPVGASSGGILKPEYVTDSINKNLDSIIQNLKSKGLI